MKKSVSWLDDLRLIIAAFFQCLALILIGVGAMDGRSGMENLNLTAGILMQCFVVLLFGTKVLSKKN